MTEVTWHVGGPSSPAPRSQGCPLTLQVLVGGEAAHQAVVVEVRGPLLQLCPLVLYHLLPVWAAGLERCRHRVGWGPSSPDRGKGGPAPPAHQPLISLCALCCLLGSSSPHTCSMEAEEKSHQGWRLPWRRSQLEPDHTALSLPGLGWKHHPLLPLLG